MLKTITVRELIAKLENEDPDAKVLFTADYGDHMHTDQALPISGLIEETYINESSYSHSGYELGYDESNDDDAETFLVIR